MLGDTSTGIVEFTNGWILTVVKHGVGGKMTRPGRGLDEVIWSCSSSGRLSG